MKIKRSIESILFVSPKPLSLRELSNALEADREEVEKSLDVLISEYGKDDKGILIIENNGKYSMASSPESSKIVQKFMQSEVSGELTPASLETLTIIAYKGPIKKKNIEKIRGINCSLILRNLLLRGLIEEKEADEVEDNEYSVSLDFIKFLGIAKIEELPEYASFRENKEIDEVINNSNA